MIYLKLIAFAFMLAGGQIMFKQAAIRMVANDLHRLNQSVMKAVDAGVSVELVRSARHHGGDGNWGDLLIPVIVTQGK